MEEVRRVHGSKISNKPFPKLLGTVPITEVFEIEMGMMNMGKMNSEGKWYKTSREISIIEIIGSEEVSLSPGGIKEFWERDGFKSAEDMFKWFDKKYSLDQPKRFAVYRWEWKP